MKDDENIYMIYSPHGHAPQGVTAFFNEAMSDAKKLSDKYPGESFHVMQAVNELRMPLEVIEIGDTAKRTDIHGGSCREGIVAGINHDEQAVIIYPDCQFGVAPIDRLKFIRKGPKVHTFEGVHYENPDGSQYPMAYQNIGRVMGSIAARGLVNNGKTYTMTLKEEVSDGLESDTGSL